MSEKKKFDVRKKGGKVRKKTNQFGKAGERLPAGSLVFIDTHYFLSLFNDIISSNDWMSPYGAIIFGRQWIIHSAGTLAKRYGLEGPT